MVALPGSHGTWQEMAVALDRGVAVFTVGDHLEVLPGTRETRICDLIPELEYLTKGSTGSSDQWPRVASA
jgi:hypothetical protein